MRRPSLLLEDLIYSVIGAFFEVYNTLGYGFLEHLYRKALERELLARRHNVAREVWVTVMYKGGELGKQRLDMVVDDCIVIEIKSTHELQRNATRQLFNYLRAMDLTAGMLLHFGPEPRFFESHHLPDRSLVPHRPAGIQNGGVDRMSEMSSILGIHPER